MGDEREEMKICIREFNAETDTERVEEMERRCEVGPSGGVSLYTDLMGDPICRIRHTPAYTMLVAEDQTMAERNIVGLIRGSIKTVVCGIKKQEPEQIPLYTKAAYVLGLRVSPTHRRKGIGLRLVEELEKWLKTKEVDYAYMATEKDNDACIKLFVEKCNFTQFRTPALLVHPVHSHPKNISSSVKILEIDAIKAEALYRKCMGMSEFFPQDIDAVLHNKLSLGTWVAFPKNERWPGAGSWAVLSAWSSIDYCKMQVKGVCKTKRIYAAATRFFDRALPWLKIPSIPNVFSPFGVHFLYGLHAQGPKSGKLMGELWWFAHNLAREKKGCKVIAAEVANCDPLKSWIPYWDSFSCLEDLWCIKKLNYSGEKEDGSKLREVMDWTMSTPNAKLFVDPREF